MTIVQDEINALEAEVARLTVELEAAKAEIVRQANVISGLQASLAAAQSQISNLQTANSALSTQIGNLTNELNDASESASNAAAIAATQVSVQQTNAWNNWNALKAIAKKAGVATTSHSQIQTDVISYIDSLLTPAADNVYTCPASSCNSQSNTVSSNSDVADVYEAGYDDGVDSVQMPTPVDTAAHY